MNKLTIVPALAIALAFSSATPEAAEAQTRFGPEAAFADDLELGLGFRITKDIAAFSDDEDSILQELRGIGDFVYYLDPFSGCDQCSAFEVNVNGVVPIDLGSADVYAGGGLNFTRISIDTGIDVPGFVFDASSSDVALNVLGGLNFDLGSFAAFAEAGVQLGGAGQLTIKSGLLLGGDE